MSPLYIVIIFLKPPLSRTNKKQNISLFFRLHKKNFYPIIHLILGYSLMVEQRTLTPYI